MVQIQNQKCGVFNSIHLNCFFSFQLDQSNEFFFYFLIKSYARLAKSCDGITYKCNIYCIYMLYSQSFSQHFIQIITIRKNEVKNTRKNEQFSFRIIDLPLDSSFITSIITLSYLIFSAQVECIVLLIVVDSIHFVIFLLSTRVSKESTSYHKKIKTS